MRPLNFSLGLKIVNKVTLGIQIKITLCITAQVCNGWLVNALFSEIVYGKDKQNVTYRLF